MDSLSPFTDPHLFVLCLGIGLVAGFVKGMVGFALPLILISGMSSIIPPELALAGLLFPTLLGNLWQGFRQGIDAAVKSLSQFKVFLAVAGVMLVISAQMVLLVPTQAMFILIGLPVTGFTFLQLLGWRPRVAPEHRLRAEIGVGAFAGAMGGFSGTWGPPTILLLIALDTPKREHIRIQGVLYAMGSVVFVLAHVVSGVLNRETLPFALAMLVPTMGGMWLGLQVQDRIDQRFFQKVTLVVLFFAGLNLIRRGFVG
jgi:uncharacterized membrane protein YfcA